MSNHFYNLSKITFFGYTVIIFALGILVGIIFGVAFK